MESYGRTLKEMSNVSGFSPSKINKLQASITNALQIEMERIHPSHILPRLAQAARLTTPAIEHARQVCNLIIETNIFEDYPPDCIAAISILVSTAQDLKNNINPTTSNSSSSSSSPGKEKVTLDAISTACCTTVAYIGRLYKKLCDEMHSISNPTFKRIIHTLPSFELLVTQNKTHDTSAGKRKSSVESIGNLREIRRKE